MIMDWTLRLKAMKPYIDIAEKTKPRAMNIFDQALKF
jgi:hypothetical protein